MKPRSPRCLFRRQARHQCVCGPKLAEAIVFLRSLSGTKCQGHCLKAEPNQLLVEFPDTLVVTVVDLVLDFALELPTSRVSLLLCAGGPHLL